MNKDKDLDYGPESGIIPEGSEAVKSMTYGPESGVILDDPKDLKPIGGASPGIEQTTPHSQKLIYGPESGVFGAPTPPKSHESMDKNKKLTVKPRVIDPTKRICWIDEKAILGRGASGTVFKGEWGTQQQKVPVAVKKFDPYLISLNRVAFWEMYAKEIAYMSKIILLKSDYLLQIKVFREKEPYVLITELMDGGSLYDLLKDTSRDLPWSTRLQIALDITYGLRDLHNAKILHRDIKSLNILLTRLTELTRPFRAKLGDFGLSKTMNRTLNPTKCPKGTLAWMAPEALEEKDTTLSSASDIYSLGMVFWELATRKVPFADISPFDLKSKIKAGAKETVPEDCPPELSSLIHSCWETISEKRPTVTYIADRLEALLESISTAEKKPEESADSKQTQSPPPTVTESETATEASTLNPQRFIPAPKPSSSTGQTHPPASYPTKGP